MNQRYISIILFSTLFLTGCSFTLAQDVTPPPGYTPAATLPPAVTASVYPLLPPDPEQGKTAYDKECASCHGLTGKGDGSQADKLSDPPTILKDKEKALTTPIVAWYDQITNHSTSNSMPAYSSVLDDRTRWDISAYLYMLNTTNEDLVLGRELYTVNCETCHGAKGKGNGPDAGGLTLEPPDFTFERILPPRSDQELFDIVSNGSANVMPAYSALLSEAERKAVISYIRTLSFSGVTIALTPEPEPLVETQTVTQPVTKPSEVVTPSATDRVSVYGKIINDSGGDLPQSLKVTLRIFDNMEETGSIQTQVNTDGSYRFDNIQMTSDRIVIATVEYEGQVFNSEPSRLPTANTEDDPAASNGIELDIHVSETTSDISTVSVDRLHVFFDFSRENVVQVVELFLISNSSNQTIVPASAESGVLAFDLPTEAANLQFQDSVIGERYLTTATGFVDTAPVPPGNDSLQVLFAFDLPYADKATISLPIPYDTNSVIVMAPSEGVKFKSDMLVDGGLKTTEQSTYQVYNGSNLKASANLTFTLTGRSKSNASAVGEVKFDTGLIGGILLGLVVIISGFYLNMRRKQIAKAKVPVQPIATQDKNALMDAIIALDEQFKNEKIAESAYKQRRAELKEELKKLL